MSKKKRDWSSKEEKVARKRAQRRKYKRYALLMGSQIKLRREDCALGRGKGQSMRSDGCTNKAVCSMVP